MTETLALDDIEQTRDHPRDQARRKLGVTGDDNTAGFRTVVRKYGLSYYPVMALGLLLVTDSFQTYAFTVLTPEISRTLGISIGGIAAARALYQLSSTASPLPTA